MRLQIEGGMVAQLVWAGGWRLLRNQEEGISVVHAWNPRRMQMIEEEYRYERSRSHSFVRLAFSTRLQRWNLSVNRDEGETLSSH